MGVLEYHHPEGQPPKMPDNSFSENDLTQLQTGMVGLHEVFMSALQAGFTEQQAMTIVLEIMRMQGAA